MNMNRFVVEKHEVTTWMTQAYEYDNSDTGYRPCNNASPTNSSLILIRKSLCNDDITIQQLNNTESNNLMRVSSYSENDMEIGRDIL